MVSTVEPLYIRTPLNKDTSLQKTLSLPQVYTTLHTFQEGYLTLSSAALVSVLEGFHCKCAGVCIVWGGCHTGVEHTSGDPSC